MLDSCQKVIIVNIRCPLVDRLSCFSFLDLRVAVAYLVTKYRCHQNLIQTEVLERRDEKRADVAQAIKQAAEIANEV